MRLRIHSKDAIIQSILEDRLARAEASKSQQYTGEDLARLVPGAEIDIWRESDQKQDPGWKGPAELVRLYKRDGKAIICGTQARDTIRRRSQARRPQRRAYR